MNDLAQRLAGLSPAKRALLERRLATPKPATAPPPSPTAGPIAIVGMGCRFPGAKNPEEFWRLIVEGREAIRDIPLQRWDVERFYDASGAEPGKTYVRRAGLVDDIDLFDPQFFGITPREANRMDPQQRLLLEVAWETLENAGRPADSIAGSPTGVFIGIGGVDYTKVPSGSSSYYTCIDAHMGTGNALSIAANRLSYIFDLHGPSFAIDTACSSSSMAIHLAMQSLRRGECTAALAGGVNAILTPETTIAFSKARMLSADGRCRPFDAGANGYVRGEGCGLVMLKPLEAALRDGDTVLAVLRGAAANQDGRTSGISAPNGEQQKACILAALEEAELDPGAISYVEAHGTGTPLGDPIEMRALGQIFARATDDQSPVWVTSVKANIGHMETVSGVAGLIKLVQMMQHRRVPPQLHLEKLNPHIDLTGTRLVVPREGAAWLPDQGMVRAGVSSFGFGGANTHMVVESPPTPTPASERKPLTTHLLKLSAKNSGRLVAEASQLAEALANNPQWDPADFAFAVNTGRAEFPSRVALSWDDRAGLEAGLAAIAGGATAHNIRRGDLSGHARLRAAWLCTGQGAQYFGMGRDLYSSQPVFREVIDRCDSSLRGVLERPLIEVLWDGEDTPAAAVHQTAFTQPALFALEVALGRQWMAWGVTPAAYLGHSIGEYAAATLAGAVRLEDALLLVAERARLMQEVSTEGGMAAVTASEARVAELLQRWPELAIAAVNAPESVVISGATESLEAALAEFTQQGVALQRLNVSHAFHSPMMDGVLDRFEAFAAKFTYHPPKVPIAWNLTGRVSLEAPTALYWRDHLRGTVRFADGVAALGQLSLAAMLEIGPTATLLGLAKRCGVGAELALIPSLRKGQPEGATMASAVAELYCRGAQIDWRAWDMQHSPRRLPIPNTPYERTRCWLEVSETPMAAPVAEGHPLLGVATPSASPGRTHQTTLLPTLPDYLADHVVQGSVVTPAAAYFELALAAAQELFGPGRHGVSEVEVHAPMFLSADKPRRVQTLLAAEAAGRAAVQVYGAGAEIQPGEPWQLHASAVLRHANTFTGSTGDDEDAPPSDLDSLRTAADLHTEGAELYAELARLGLAYGPNFRPIAELWSGPGWSIARLEPSGSVLGAASRYSLHPALGDACLQTIAGALAREEEATLYLPVGAAEVRVFVSGDDYDPQAGLWCYAKPRPSQQSDPPDTLVADAWLVDGSGLQLASVLGVRLQRVGGAKRKEATGPRLFETHWREATAPTGEIAEGAWLVVVLGGPQELADDTPGHFMFQRILDLLQGRGAVIAARAGNDFRMTPAAAHNEPNQIEFNPGDAAHLRRLLEVAYANPTKPPVGVVLVAPAECDAAPEAVWEETRSAVVGATLLLQQLARRGARPAQGVCLVQQGGTALEGLFRTAQLELPELSPRIVDVQEAGGATPDSALLAELAGADAMTEDQVRLQGVTRSVARVAEAAPLRTEFSAVTGQAFQLRIPQPGTLEALRLTPFQRTPPGPGQVEIAVRAAGLNFSDVLKALGLYPGVRDAIVPLGIEASGIVTRVGEGATRFAPGDAVVGVVPYAFGSHATSAEYALARKPAALSDPDAATLPIALMTAHYALVWRAQLAPGERVLLHAGAGGVGLAALQVAQHVGATVFATAGSPTKRDYLHSLGIEHVFSSRSLDFVEDVRRVTGREGVDVVLNSLPGDFIPASLGLLRAYGRFLEIGKTDIYQNRPLGLAPFQDNLSYFAIDLDRLLRQRAAEVRRLMDEVMELVEAGVYKPIAHTEFAAEGVVDAFRYMQQRKNIGKVVVSMPTVEITESTADDGAPVSIDPNTAAALPSVRSDGAYLVTGGLGALGLRVAAWLIERGAGAVLLASRRAPTGDALPAIEALRSAGGRVECLACDVADEEALKGALAKLPQGLPPLRGVIHAAGVLDDGLLLELTPERIEAVLRPKVLGAWSLHAATLSAPLDFFVLFSSVAAALGSPGQANYAAANAALDALAEARRRRGLPGTSIQWGPWGDGGMAAQGARAASVAAKGMAPLAPEAGLRFLEELIGAPGGAGAASLLAIDPRWDAMSRALGGRDRPLLREVLAGLGVAAAPTADRALRDALLALPEDELRSSVTDLVRNDLARVMSLDPTTLDPNQPLAEMGLDSLMALELKNSLERRLDINLPMAKLLEGPSVRSLAEEAARLLTGDGAPSSAEGWNPLVCLREGDSTQLPIFLMPALGGDVRSYRDLVAAMVSGGPVFALRPRGLDDNAAPHDSMQQLAADYAEAISQRAEGKSIALAGWSTGGVTAFAVAARLRALGRPVDFVALFDTPLPETYAALDLDDDARFLAEMMRFVGRIRGRAAELSPDTLQSLDAEERFKAALDAARRGGLIPPEASEGYVRRLVGVGAGLIRACRAYKAAPLDLPIHLYRPQLLGVLDEITGREQPPGLGWERQVGQQVIERTVPGDHFTMMQGEGAQRLAEELAGLLSP